MNSMKNVSNLCISTIGSIYYACCRPAPRPDQEQQHEEARGQDADGDSAWRADQQGARQAGGAGRQPGLCHAHWPCVFLLPIESIVTL